MYSHCIYCKQDLGSNESLELFPVGRRLAFDERRGRLWVVCRRCGRWNLSPLESRWEAVEACERLYRVAQRRVSSENISMVRLGDGLDLVRIGAPDRPELAAWRYGRTFLRRWWRERLMSSASSTGGMLASGLSLPLTWPLVVPAVGWHVVREHRIVARFQDDDGRTVMVKRRHARRTRLLPAGDGWQLVVTGADGRTAELTGDAAVRAAGELLPHINHRGATELQVEVAVRQLERQGTGSDYFRHAATAVRAQSLFGNAASAVRRAPAEVRLALEMAAHEETERRAMQGELRDLEAAWQAAEEIAAIADDLLLPPRVRALYTRLRQEQAGSVE